MKILIIFLCVLSGAFIQNANELNHKQSIEIECVGQTDKPIEPVRICTFCESKPQLKQYRITASNFNFIKDVFHLDSKLTISRISVNEKNRKKEIHRLTIVLQQLKKSNEQHNLIEALETFIKRIK